MSRVLILVGALLLGVAGCANAPACETNAVSATCPGGEPAECVHVECDDDLNCPEGVEPCRHAAGCDADGVVVCGAALCPDGPESYRSLCR